MSASIRFIEEFRLSAPERQAIRQLLRTCFPNAPYPRGKTYLKQAPPYRMLAHLGDRLVGHMGVEHRVINLSGEPGAIFGVADLCVAPEARSRDLAGRMLDRLGSLARRHAVPFIVLFADDARLYRRHGYTHHHNRLRWLKIHEHETIGIGDEAVAELMVRPLGDRAWPDGPVDLLGHLF